jgi:sec-independent protein translocase protein TatC
MSEEPEKLAEGTLISHLLELRDRLIRAVAAVIVVFIPCAYFSNDIFAFIAQPLIEKLPKGASIIATSVISPFVAPLKLSFYVALIIAMPYVLYQIWAFIAPGLYRHEKRFAVPLLVSSIILFFAGIGFAYFAVFPVIFQFFTHTAPKGVVMMTDINQYMDFVLTMFFAFGVAFEVPVAVVLLVATGVIGLDKLTHSRGYVLIAIFVIAAILTPPDALSQCMMAIPMYGLYEGGILMARLMVKARREGSGGTEDPGKAEA